jgi:hypothetical protein
VCHLVHWPPKTTFIGLESGAVVGKSLRPIRCKYRRSAASAFTENWERKLEDSSVTRKQIASTSVESVVGVQVLEQARGSRRGNVAIALQKGSDLADLQEEIGNSVGKLADKRTLAQAKLRQGAGVNVEAIKRIADYYDKLPDAPREDRLRTLVKMLQGFGDLLKGGGGGGGRDVGVADVLQALNASDSNARKQYMLLQGARIHFERESGNATLLDLLDQAEKSFNETGIAYDVRSDYAMLAHARTVGPSVGIAPEALRDKYREMLLSGMNLGTLFYTLSDFKKRLNFHAVVDLFLKAAGDDLAAVSSQGDRSFLGNLLKELGILKTLRTTFEASGALLGQMQRMFPRFGDGDGKAGVHELVGELLSFCSKPMPSLEDGRKIITPFDDNAPAAARVVFSNGLLDLHREMPDQVFPSSQARLQQVGVLNEVSKYLVELEEVAYQAANS